MTPSGDEAARVQVELASQVRTRLVEATPLRELRSTTADLSRVQPLLAQLAAAIARLLDTDLAVVWTTAPDQEVLLPSAWVGFPDDYIGPMRVPYGTGSAGRAVVERAVVLVEDVATSPHYGPFREGALQHGVRTVLSVPMLTLDGEPTGCLSTYYRDVFVPQERDLELADVYARQAAEIVERARLHAEARALAELEQQRGQQLRGLADAALALSAADDLDELLRLVTDAALSVIGCHQGVTTRLPTGWADATTYVALSEQYAEWRAYDVVPKGLGVLNAVTRENRPLRLTAEQLLAHPEYRHLRDAPGHPPMPDYLAAPLVGRDGANLGLVQLSHKLDDSPFTAEDEAILVQLAQMASSTVERLEAFDRERAARREAEQAAGLRGVLSEASAAFAESFDPQGIAQVLVEAAVPRLGELAVLHLVDEAGELVLASCTATAGEARARAFFGAAPVLRGVPYGPAAVLASGEPQVLDTADRASLRAVCRTDAQAAELGAVLRASAACLPLTARGRTLGVLTVSREQPYDAADVDHALDLARRAALALDNAIRYAFERELAVTLQRSLLPRAIAPPAGLTAAARYLPGAQGTQVGGDWYDLLEVDGKVVLVVGDVMGRGVPAAALMGQLRATTAGVRAGGPRPGRRPAAPGRRGAVATGLHFTTCVVGVLDPVDRTLCLASAGHLPPVVVAPGGGAHTVPLDPGLPLGVGGGISPRAPSSSSPARWSCCTPTGSSRPAPRRWTTASSGCSPRSPTRAAVPRRPATGCSRRWARRGSPTTTPRCWCCAWTPSAVRPSRWSCTSSRCSPRRPSPARRCARCSTAPASTRTSPRCSSARWSPTPSATPTAPRWCCGPPCRPACCASRCRTRGRTCRPRWYAARGLRERARAAAGRRPRRPVGGRRGRRRQAALVRASATLTGARRRIADTGRVRPRTLLPALLLLVGCTAPEAADPGQPGVPVPDGAQEATVVRVVDGDTVQLEGIGDGPLRDGDRTRVRVLLIDTPEVHTEQECFGEEAFARARELLPEGSTVRVEADEDPRDRFDRALLHLWTEDGVNVGEALLREGFAEVLVVRPNELYLDAFDAAERAAQDDALGLWSECSE